MRWRTALAWVFIWPAFISYYAAGSLLVLVLLVFGSIFRLILGPDPKISNCGFWTAWQWISQSWADWRAGRKPPGGYVVIRWSSWGPFWHLGWVEPGSIKPLSFVPPEHVKRVVPPPLFRGHVERGY